MKSDIAHSSSRLSQAWRATRIAFAFLTIIPLHAHDEEIVAADVANSRFAYPLVGAVIGLLLAALSELLDRMGTGLAVAAFVLVAAEVLVAGALHLDGLADSFDGLFLPGGAERRLAVMRDPHLGSFGVAAIVLVLLGKYAAMGQFVGRSRTWAILGAALISRTLILVSAGLSRYARPEGTGRIVIEATTLRDSVGASVLILILAAAVGGRGGLLAGAAALVLARIWTGWSHRAIDGITGDTLGALVELGGMVFLLVMSACSC